MRKRLTVLLGVFVAVTGIVAAVALAKTQTSAFTKFTATLNAKQEVPKAKHVPAGADGTFTAKLKGTTLQWTLTFEHLSGATTKAHVYLGAKGKSGAVLIALCGSTCRSPVSGATLVTSQVASALKSGKTYVNVHTRKNPNGEIRGQIHRG
jgi:hypothetical protein